MKIAEVDNMSKINKNLIITMLSPSDQKTVDSIQIVVTYLTRLLLTPKQMHEALMPFENEILAYLTRLSKEEPIFKVKIFAENVYWLYKTGKWPKVEELINNTKPRLIKLMLINIIDKRYVVAKETQFLLKNMLHLDWPELDIIGKSLNALLTDEDKSFITRMQPVRLGPNINENRIEQNKKKAIEQFHINYLTQRMRAAEIGIRNGVTNPIQSFINSLDTLGMSTAEIHKLLLQIENKIIEYLNYLINRPQSQLDIKQFVYNIESLYTIAKWPKIEPLVEKAKPKLIKYILGEFKDGEPNYMNANIMVWTLTNKLHINWPELATIKKSLDELESERIKKDGNVLLEKRRNKRYTDTFTHDGQLYSLPKLIRIIQKNRIRKFNIKSLLWIFKYDDPRYDEPHRIKTADLKEPIIVTRWQNKLVVLDGLHRLAKAYIKGINYLPGRMVFRHELARAKLDKKSTNESFNAWISLASENTKRLKFLFNQHAIRLVFMNIKQSKLDDENCPELSEIILQHKTEIINYIITLFKEIMSTNKSNQKVIKWFDDLFINTLERLGFNWPEIDGIKNSLEKDIFNEADITNGIITGTYELIKHELDHGLTYAALVEITRSGLTVNSNPKLIQLIIEYKPQLIKKLLEYAQLCIISGGTWSDEIIDMTNALKQLGANWSELDVIQNSINAEKSNIHESLNNWVDTGEYYGRVQRRLEQNHIRSAIMDIQIFQLDYKNCPGIDKLLSVYKHQIIEYILKIVKDDMMQPEMIAYNNCRDMLRSIMALRNCGIYWKELEVIADSLNNFISSRQVNESDDRITSNSLKYRLENGYVGSVLYSILDRFIAREYRHELIEVLSEPKYKSIVIKYLLSRIKETVTLLNSDRQTFNGILELITALEMIGIKWEELTRIKQCITELFQYDGPGNNIW